LGIYEIKSEKEFKSLVNKDEDRAVLLKKILEYCEKEWIPEQIFPSKRFFFIFCKLPQKIKKTINLE
jgi:hypothetical protein